MVTVLANGRAKRTEDYYFRQRMKCVYIAEQTTTTENATFVFTYIMS